MTAKPTVEELGIDVLAQAWQRSGGDAGSIEIAFVGIPAVGGAGPVGPGPAAGYGGQAAGDGEWVLMRVADDPAQRVLVYDRNEWDCFLHGVKNGEFDDATE